MRRRWGAQSDAPEQGLVRCPRCLGALTVEEHGLACGACWASYVIRNGQPDLRPPPTSRSLEVRLGAAHDNAPAPEVLEAGPWPPLDVPDEHSYRYGNRLTRALTTYLPPADDGQTLLDLGCGNCKLGQFLANGRGYRYFGVDTEGTSATALADGHCLPFESNTFAAVCTFAVLEHVRVPHLVAAELHRVLQSRGVVIGTVAFLEPFHRASQFHHTHLGLAEILEGSGFEDIHIEANRDWLATDALFEMYTSGRVRGVRRIAPFANVLFRGLFAMPRSLGQELATVSAGFRFVARKPSSDEP